MDPREVSDFLYLLSGVVDASLSLKLDEGGSNIPDDIEVVEEIRKTLSKLRPSQWNKYFSTSSSSIQLKRITHESPIEIIFYIAPSCLFLLTLAVILSGGKIKSKLPGGTETEAELPPIGDGIRNLRNSLGLDRPDRLLGFGIQSVTIKLTQEELGHLMKDATGTGGFQHFLNKLQNKVNKSTREITLSVEDLDRIESYRANPSAGGFQGRYNKIFKKHLESPAIEMRHEGDEG